MKKKILSSLLAAVLIFGAVNPVFAETSKYVGTTSGTTATDTTTADASKSATVTATKAENFSVTIPKTINLSGSGSTIGKGSYNVSVTGDIAGDAYVEIVPAATFNMKQTGKADILTTVTQPITKFRSQDYSSNLPSGSVKIGGSAATGNISMAKVSAGTWSGTLNFTIALKYD